MRINQLYWSRSIRTINAVRGDMANLTSRRSTRQTQRERKTKQRKRWLGKRSGLGEVKFCSEEVEEDKIETIEKASGE